MRTTKIFLMAALALTFAACSNDDNEILAPEQPAPQAEGIPFTATISIGESAATRALSESGSDLVASWAVGEKVALIHNGVNDEMEVESVSGGVATISGTLKVFPSDGDDVTVIYPSSAAADDATGNVKPDLLYAQNGGTLADVAANYEVRKGTGTLKVDGTATLDGYVSLENQFSIFKFTLDDGSGPIAATSFTFTYGEQDYVVTPGSATSTLYVALPVLTASTYFFIAEVGSDSYIAKATVSAATSAGNYYDVPVSMTKRTVVDLSFSDDYTAQNGDILTGDCNHYAKISIADGAIVTLRNVSISNEVRQAGLTLLGDATIILESTNSVECYDEDGQPQRPGIYVLDCSTLTIGGTGSLTAKGKTGIGAYYENSCGNITICGGTVDATGYNGAGIGGCSDGDCGDITISGGTVTATSLDGSSAGIGSGYETSCGDITISGGTIIATGSYAAAGIGSGYSGTCGDITITNGVTKVTATKGSDAPDSIGAGFNGSCTGVTIGGVVGAISDDTYTYMP